MTTFPVTLAEQRATVLAVAQDLDGRLVLSDLPVNGYYLATINVRKPRRRIQGASAESQDAAVANLYGLLEAIADCGHVAPRP